MLCASAAATAESTAPQAARLRNVAIMTVLRGWARLPGCLTSLLKPLPTVPTCAGGWALTNVQSVLGEVRSMPPVGVPCGRGRAGAQNATRTDENANSASQSGVRDFHGK